MDLGDSTEERNDTAYLNYSKLCFRILIVIHGVTYSEKELVLGKLSVGGAGSCSKSGISTDLKIVK